MKLIPARLSIIKPSRNRSFDIYAIEDGQPVLILSKNTALKKSSILFKSYLNRKIFIKAEQLNAYKQFIAENIDDVMKDNDIPQNNKLYAVYVAFTNQLEELIEKQNISIAKGLLKDISKFIGSTINDVASISVFLTFLENNIDNIATHMFNVGVYATMLTKTLFPQLSLKELEELSKGYFLHDIGMIKIDKDIVTKTDKYTKEEYEEIKKHPQLGADILEKDLGVENEDVIKIVLEHHERKDGSGYPEGKTDINVFARICSICDIFDAITSKREYKDSEPQTTFEALKSNKEYFIEEFGKEFYEAFIISFKPMK